MACYQCMDTFTLLKRQHGCPNCGFGFCGKCITKKVPVPKLGNKAEKVCDNCYKRLTNPDAYQKEQNPWELPENFKKRLNMPPTFNEHSYGQKPPHGGGQKQFIHPHSVSLLESRLDKLKASGADKDPPSLNELETRLHKLKENPNAESQKVSSIPDAKTLDPVFTRPPLNEEEQISQLMDQYKSLVEIDGNSENPEEMSEDKCSNTEDPTSLISQTRAAIEREKSGLLSAEEVDKNLRQRLDALHSEGSRINGRDLIPTRPLTDEEQAREIEARILMENRLEEKFGKIEVPSSVINHSKQPSKTPIDEDYPWCCICTEEATLKCPQCDDDLYCVNCSRQSHAMPGYGNHKPFQFVTSS